MTISQGVRNNFTWLFVGVMFFVPMQGVAQTTYDANSLLSSVSLQFSPRQASFVEGSTFEVPLLIDTKGVSVNTLNITVRYDADMLSITNPAGGTSIIGLWLEPPSYDNQRGTASYVGAVPNGIVTSSGIIGTITFKAKKTGTAVVRVQEDSEVLLNDGFGSQARVEYGSARYTIVQKAPEGVPIYSETHPSQEAWYNNNSPVFAWDPLAGVNGYSVVFDTFPATVPPTTVTTTAPSVSYENLDDGLWYLHVRAQQNGVWGNTGHYLVRIDTTPPAKFRPQSNYVLAATIVVERVLLSFFTTDNLSGVERYEVGVIDKSSPTTASPVFIQTESPYQLPSFGEAGAHVIVRAVDRAGNIRDAGIDVSATPMFFASFLKEYSPYVLGGLVLLLILGFLVHYLYGHHLIAHARRAFQIMKKEEEEEHTPASSTSPPLSSASTPPPVPPAPNE
jgi:hypothetical protein